MDQVVRGRSTTSQDEVVTHGVEAYRRNAAGPPIFPSEVVNYVCILEYECNPTLLLVGCAAGQSCNIRTQATATSSILFSRCDASGWAFQAYTMNDIIYNNILLPNSGSKSKKHSTFVCI